MLGGAQTRTATVESSMAVPQEAGDGSTSRACCATPGHRPKALCIILDRDTYASVFIAALFLIAQDWIQPGDGGTEQTSSAASGSLAAAAALRDGPERIPLAASQSWVSVPREVFPGDKQTLPKDS